MRCALGLIVKNKKGKISEWKKENEFNKKNWKQNRQKWQFKYAVTQSSDSDEQQSSKWSESIRGYTKET